jgi:mannose-6-phosphate isomerase-like protein (cupin superfamily)
MKRRTVLTSACIAIAGVTGCASEAGRDGGNDTRTDGAATVTPTLDGTETTRPDETAEPTSTDRDSERLEMSESTTGAGGTSLTVANPTVQSSIIAYNSQFLSIGREEGIQFVVVSVKGDTDVNPSSFVLLRNGSVQSPPQTQQYVRSITRECEGTCIGIPVEAEAAESAAIAYRSEGEVRAVWELDEATIAAFSTVPDVRLQDATITDENGDVGVEFSVDNVGKRDGAFLGLVAPAWLADAGEPVGFTVPRGDTATETVVPSEIQRLDPDDAEISGEPTADTRYFEIESSS